MKRIIWVGQAYQDLLNFPKQARREAGYNLDRVQKGMNPVDWKPMKSIGPGVKELRIHTENEYRIVYIANFHEAVYVLHSFTKKSQKTNNNDISIAKERLKKVILMRSQ